MQARADQVPGTSIESVKLLSPVANPGKIVAAPVNYALHLDESRADTAINFGTQVKTIADYGVFLKATSSVIGASQTVMADWPDRRIDHEVELALVIGRKGFRIPESQALSHVAGYMIGLDMTIRGTEDRSFRKSLDTFTVLGPWLVTADELGDPSQLDLEITVNGQPRQKSNTALLIWNVQKLIAYASQAYTLYPGDVIMTGTPEGVAPVVPGDTMRARIERIGQMQVAVGP
jgi:2-keto-4-pentenoate hydratase/2-oxohepta-3-ene-1,7-dioic acid hydratase in catechol pathway